VDGAAQMPQVNGLDQVVEGPTLHAKSCTGRVIYCSQHQKGDGGVELHDLRHQLDPADPGHVHVEQHARDPLPMQDGQRLHAAGGGGDLVSLLDQKFAERVADRFFVVYDEQCNRPIGLGHTNSSSRARCLSRDAGRMISGCSEGRGW
jgi:hypothetical protein